MILIDVYPPEQEVKKYLDAGVLRIDGDGSIWRCKVRRVGNGWSRWDDREPTRAEVQGGDHLRVFLACGGGFRLVFRANRLVWTFLVGTIPEGRSVWHRDGDLCNNDPANLYIPDGSVQSKGRVRDSWLCAHQARALRYRERFMATLDRLRDACDHPLERRLLEAVVDHGSVTNASVALGCSRSTLDYHLRKIVVRAGVPVTGRAVSQGASS